MSRLALALAAFALGACASPGAMPASAPAPAVVTAPGRPAAVNPVGSFEFTTEVNGSPMKGSLRIAGAPGAYSGTMTSDITPELPITSLSVDGQKMKIVMDTPNGAATINLLFMGDNFSGNWELGGAGGPLVGKRIK